MGSIPAGARVDRFIVRIVRCTEGLEDIFARTGAGVKVTGLDQSIQRFPVERQTPTLIVGSARPAAIRAFLPLKAEPAQVIEHGLHKLRTATDAIEILIAQDEDPLLLSRAFLGDPERARVAQMQITRWGWCQTTAINGGVNFQ
jgi:hypothetical protein